MSNIDDDTNATTDSSVGKVTTLHDGRPTYLNSIPGTGKGLLASSQSNPALNLPIILLIRYRGAVAVGGKAVGEHPFKQGERARRGIYIRLFYSANSATFVLAGSSGFTTFRYSGKVTAKRITNTLT